MLVKNAWWAHDAAREGRRLGSRRNDDRSSDKRAGDHGVERRKEAEANSIKAHTSEYIIIVLKYTVICFMNLN